MPEEPYEIDYTSDVKREGEDLTIVTYSAMVNRSLKAAEELEKEGISVEVVDIRTLEPLDIDPVITSVKKTGRALVVHEACKKGGFGAEIAAQIQEQAFFDLKSEIVRIGAPNVPVPFAVNLEKMYVPEVSLIVDTVRKMMKGN